MAVRIAVQEAPLNLADLYARADDSVCDCGAQVTFTGYVRRHDHAVPVTHLFLQHYPEVTESELQRIVQAAEKKWKLNAVVVAHRVGKIAVGEPVVWVMTQAAHRGAAYDANEFIMDYLKIAAPFWKKECFADGTELWVEAKKSDADKSQMWGV